MKCLLRPSRDWRARHQSHALLLTSSSSASASASAVSSGSALTALSAPSEMTPNQLAEIEASNLRRKEIELTSTVIASPCLTQNCMKMQRPSLAATRDEFSKYFERIWGNGWKAGYYAKTGQSCSCPLPDADDNEIRIWNDGHLYGAKARKTIEKA